MECAVVIPARYNSSRFPGKPLARIAGKYLVQLVWEKCIQAFAKESVFVATDDNRIQEQCEHLGINVVMTSTECLTGTDRLCEVSNLIDAKCYINVQGDEPLVLPSDIQKIYTQHLCEPDIVHYGMCEICDEPTFRNYNVPKVVVDERGFLLYASRAAIPITKDGSFRRGMKQVCISAFSIDHLDIFRSSHKTPLESIEDIEILRLLERGVPIKMVQVSSTVAVDHPSDIPVVEAHLYGL